MATTLITPEVQQKLTQDSIQQHIATIVDDLMAKLPAAEKLTYEQRRGIIARYTAVLEGNFIYWMTATFIAAKAKEAHPILLENLYEECRDSHPAMMRRFAIAANAVPTAEDAMAMNGTINDMRMFLGRLDGVRSLVSMAFFEGWIQKFMAYLASLADAQGSTEMEYTDVHGVCDITHSLELFRAVSLEMKRSPVDARDNIFEGVDLLAALVENIVEG